MTTPKTCVLVDFIELQLAVSSYVYICINLVDKPCSKHYIAATDLDFFSSASGHLHALPQLMVLFNFIVKSRSVSNINTVLSEG